MLVRFFRRRRSLLLENLALRQQLVMIAGASCTLTSRSIRRALGNPRPSLGLFDKLFWVIARRVWPFEASHKYLILDRDQKFGFEAIAAVKATRIISKRTSFRSPWQNGIAERWEGSCRRDLQDRTVALNERHLKRLLCEYVRYHHEDRTHLGLEKGTPDGRIRSAASGRVLSQERLGGLHRRYNRAA